MCPQESHANSDETWDSSDGDEYSPDDEDGLLAFSISFPGRVGWKTVLLGGVLGLFY